MNILFTGDIVIANPNNFKLSHDLANYINNHDIRCCNLEAPICVLNEKPLLKAGPSLFQTKESVKMLANNNFNLCSLANNHIMDYGKQGLQNTITILKENNIDYFGAGFSIDEAYKAYTIITDNQKVAIIACSQAEFGVIKENYNISGYAWIQSHKIKKIITQFKNEQYTIILFSHCGLEDVCFPLPEVQQIYKEFIDCGVDIIIGNHPHIVQGQEIYNGKIIFYSLGNFYFDAISQEYWSDEQKKEWNRSLIVSLNTLTQKVTCKKISLQNGILDFDESSDFIAEFEKRSSILHDIILQQKANNLAEILWKKYYKSYYDITNKYDSTLLTVSQILKLLVKKIIGKIKPYQFEINETMLLHNIQIEPHRWLVERYLYNLNLERNKNIIQ